jgi:hypothetical protein
MMLAVPSGPAGSGPVPFAYTDEHFDRAIELLSGWDLSWASAFPLADGAEVFTSLMNGALDP